MPITQNTGDRPIVEAAMARLAKVPGVHKVVGGAYSDTRHRNAPGDIKVLGPGTAGSVAVRVYTKRGMQNLHVYTTDPSGLESHLRARLVRPDGEPTPRRSPMATAMRQALETGSGSTAPAAAPLAAKAKPFEPARVGRRGKQQPVYPAEPAPMKPAAPVEGSDVSGRLVRVTADIACNWLERNTKNRRLRDVDVKKYAADMRAGRWLPGGNIIKFDVNGNIVNGQHVLWAVIEAGADIPGGGVDMFVMSGLDPSVVMVEDDHARRTLPDVVRIQHPGWAVSTKHTSIASILRVSMEWAAGRTTHKLEWEPRQVQLAFTEQHWEAIHFANSAFGSTGQGSRRGVAVGPVMAVVARAYYTVDHDRLRRFAQVVSNGIVQDTSENVAVLLRNQLLQSSGLVANSMQVKQVTYYKVERALRAFLDGESLRVLKVQPVDELFPLPGESKRRRVPKETP